MDDERARPWSGSERSGAARFEALVARPSLSAALLREVREVRETLEAGQAAPPERE